MLLMASLSTFAQNETWTVVGAADIINGTSSWDLNNNDNNMTYNAATQRYELTVTGCGLVKDKYEYKFAKDHSWDVAYPQEGNNSLEITETGTYTILFYYEPDQGLGDDGGAVATRTGDYTPPTTLTLTVAGSSVELFGTSWDPKNTANDMTQVSGTTYQLVKKGVTLAAGTIEYKITKDHDWGTNWPSNNASFAIEADGTYDVTFTTDSSTRQVSAVASVATGISELSSDRTAAVYYNLQGVRTTRATKGLYISNGRKVIVK